MLRICRSLTTFNEIFIWEMTIMDIYNSTISKITHKRISKKSMK